MKILKNLLAFNMLILSNYFSQAQFTVSGSLTGTNSPQPITVNGPTSGANPVAGDGIYIGRGNWQTGNGVYNTAIGVGALSKATSTNPGAYNNTAIGYNALLSTINGRVNVAVGAYALANSTGSNNTAVGANALSASGNTGESNTAIGSNSLNSNTSGRDNIGLGLNSLQNNDEGIQNVGIGNNSLQSGSSSDFLNNVAVGYWSQQRLTSGQYNVSLGTKALWGAVSSSGNRNIAIGGISIPNLTTGSDNCAFGYNTLRNLGSGNNNIAIGNNSLYQVSTGSYNVAIGSSADIPNGIGSPSPASDYQLSIQNVIFGLTMTDKNAGKVGIGVVPIATVAGAQSGLQPVGTFAKLHIGGSSTVPSLRLNNVPSTTALSGRSYLFVDAAGIVTQAPIPAGGTTTNTLSTSGNTITSTVNGVASSATLVNLYTSNGSINAATTISGNREVDMNSQNIWFKTNTSTSNGNIYIGNTASFPTASGNYRLYVEGGILTEKVKVALRSSANWADNVFDGDYKLIPLKKLAEFIKSNKHLPGINAADDLAKNGLDLGAMQAKQMAKIEELTLYVIDQNNKLEKQNAEIETLKATVETLLKKSK